MPNKISGYKAAELPVPVKGSGGNGQVADKSQAAAPGAAATAASAVDQLTLTGPARTMQKLSEAVAGAPVVNSAKVSAVKLAIQNGTYQVNSTQVATKMLQYERGLKPGT